MLVTPAARLKPQSTRPLPDKDETIQVLGEAQASVFEPCFLEPPEPVKQYPGVVVTGLLDTVMLFRRKKRCCQRPHVGVSGRGFRIDTQPFAVRQRHDGKGVSRCDADRLPLGASLQRSCLPARSRRVQGRFHMPQGPQQPALERP